MSDPKRLLDGAGDGFEVSLLAAGQDERPTAQAAEKVCVAIGIGGVVATGTAAATAADLVGKGVAAAGVTQAATIGTAGGVGVAKVAAAGAAMAPMVAKASVPVLLAWTGIAAMGGLGTLSAIDYLSAPAEPAPASGSVQATRGSDKAPGGSLSQARSTDHGDRAAAAAEDSDSADEGADDGPDTSNREAGEPRERADSAGDRSANAGGADGVRKRRLADEVGALDRARNALQAGDPQGALAAIDHYEATFEQRMLGPEARTLRIEALMAAGRGGEARAAAARFLAADPSSTHARRVRSLIAGEGAAQPQRP